MIRLASIRTPVIFAHRGASTNAPENTLAAFTLAITHGADAIELDVKLSQDKNVIVIHDQTVDRTTNGNGHVHTKSLKELKGYDAGSFFSPHFAKERIPTLDEVFETVGKDLLINIELTNYLTPFDALPMIVVNSVKEHRQEDNVLFSSFNPLNLLRVKNLLPQATVAILVNPGPTGIFSRSIFGRWVSPDIIHPNILDTSNEFIKKQKNLKRRIHVWTVNRAKDINKLFELSVDGIFTDDPKLASTCRDVLWK